jgi:uncharacterized protein
MSRRWILRFLMANRLSDSPAPPSAFAGWEWGVSRDDEIPGGIYTMRRGDAVGAIDQQEEQSAHWNNYVSVTSAEETAARAKRLGARILEEPFDVGEFGRLAGPFDLPSGKIAVLGDPQGAAFAIFEGETDE